jgi:hypothetical protein
MKFGRSANVLTNATETNKTIKRVRFIAIIRFSSTGKLAVWWRGWISPDSVTTAAPTDHGRASGRLDATAVDFTLHHGTPMTVASIELRDFFVVLHLGYLAVIECG